MEDEEGQEAAADLEELEESRTPTNFGNLRPLERVALLKAMKDQKAGWQEDGKGLRGDATTVSDTRAQLNWPRSGAILRRPNLDTDLGENVAAAEIPSDPDED